MLNRSPELQDPQADPRLVVARLVQQMLCECRVSLSQLAGDQIQFGQRRRLLGGRDALRQAADKNHRQDHHTGS